MKQLVFLAIAMFICVVTFAQTTQRTVVEEKAGWSEFHVGVSFPSGDLGDDKIMGAGTGFGLGFKSYKPLETILPNLSLVYGMELYYHGRSSDVKKEVEDDWGQGVDVTHPMMFNLPVTIGGNYTMPLNEGISVYGELAFGLNVSYMTKEKAEATGWEYECSYDPAFGFCYGLEAGIVFKEKYHIGIRYNNWGSYKYKYKETYGSSENKDKTPKWDVSAAVLVLGVRF